MLSDIAVKGYTQSDSSGERTGLTRADLTGDAIAFHWIDGGSKTVRFSAKVDGASKAASVSWCGGRETRSCSTATWASR